MNRRFPDSQPPPASELPLPVMREPLNVAQALSVIPEHAVAKGYLIRAVVRAAERFGAVLPSARSHYVPFDDYPLREHARLMCEACDVIYADLPLREGLRRIGWYTPGAFAQTLIGKLRLAGSPDVLSVIDAIAAGYEASLSHGRVTVENWSDGYAELRLTDVYHFLDCHHVGVFEGCVRHVRGRGSVQMYQRDVSNAQLIVRWSDESA